MAFFTFHIYERRNLVEFDQKIERLNKNVKEKRLILHIKVVYLNNN